MEKLKLMSPGPEHEAAARAYIEEHAQAGEHELHGASLLEKMESYSAWLNHLAQTGAGEREDWVRASTFFVVREHDGKIVGVIDIRHSLNDYLARYGGHIGYGVRPSERRKGYATEMLRLGLAYCKTLGLDRVMVACDQVNEASGRTICKNGGVLDREDIHPDGSSIEVYWIAVE